MTSTNPAFKYKGKEPDDIFYGYVFYRAIRKLHEIFSKSAIDSEHGIDHALTVVRHIDKAIDCHVAKQGEELIKTQILAIRLAGLLHDADDAKFFSKEHAEHLINAHTVLEYTFEHLPMYLENDVFIPLILKMIEITSFSKYGNNCCDAETGVEFHDWMLYPRLADRLEAIGEIGIKRCLIYSDNTKRPRFSEQELIERPKTLREIHECKQECKYRMENYLKGEKSKTAIGHFWDKIIWVGDFEKQTNNRYLLLNAEERMIPIYDFLIIGDWNASV